jgi:hypothetical protein
MALFTMQVSLPDRPGSLGMLASAIGSAGADIRGLEVLKTVDGVGYDQIIVAVPGTDASDLVEILNSIGGVEVLSIEAINNGQCMVVGDNQPFIASLITIDPDMLKGWIAANNKTGATVETLVNDPDLIAVIQTAVDEANKAVSKAESIRKFTILPKDFTIATGELTAKLSLKRHVISQQYAAEIAALFTK